MTLRRSTKSRRPPRWHNFIKPTATSASVKMAAHRTLDFKVKRVLISAVMVAGTVTLIGGCQRSANTASSKLPPDAEPLAQPMSLQQLGAPVETTRAAIPTDNPQTPEKISLGQRLFFDPRLSVDGTVSCSTYHDPARALTDRKLASAKTKNVNVRCQPALISNQWCSAPRRRRRVAFHFLKAGRFGQGCPKR